MSPGPYGPDPGSADEQAVRGNLPAPGELLAGRFLIEGWVAEGGMGSVLRARDTLSNELVAIKVSSRPRASHNARFSREIQMLTELSHPAIVRHVAHGTTRVGAPFFAMEWLAGEDLGNLLKSRQLSPEESVALLSRVCEGVAAAHDRGIVHRDLKPSNIFIVAGDVRSAKVLDFGVARYRYGPSHALTQAGTMLGTVGYISPEQAMGLLNIDARADVFSLGCVLFECLTGRAAFRSVHDLAVLAKVLREEPPRVSELRPELGAQADELVASMLAKDRNLRPLDARDVRRLLGQLMFKAPEPTTTSATNLRHVTLSEQRFASVVLARTRSAEPTLAPTLADQQDTEFAALAKRFAAEPLPLYGGGLLLSLAGPGAATDQARRAALFALEVQKLRPNLRVAVATGRLESKITAPIGQAIDAAAGLLAGASAQGAIVLDELTHALLDDRFDVRRAAVGWVLLGERADVDLPRLLMGRKTPCVGRDKELALLKGTLDECKHDSVARLSLVTAQPGIGKSRLVRAFLELLRAETGVRVLMTRGDQMRADAALWLVGRLIGSAAGLGGAEDLDTRRRRLHGYLSQLGSAAKLHAAAEFLEVLSGIEHGGAPSDALRAARNDPSVMAEQTRRAFETWLEAELDRSPILIVIEDAHWADSASVGYLEHSLARWAERPLCIVALARPELHERYPGLSKLPTAQEIRLPRLTKRAAEQLVRNALGASDEIVQGVVERGDGNAFYLEELARCVAEGVEELPNTVLAMVQSRLDALEIEARRVLRAASVFGMRCWSGGVAALLGHDADASAWLDTLAEREILTRLPGSRFDGQRELEFRHALLRDAAYGMLTADDQRVAHRLAGDWLEQIGERDAPLLAGHFERAGADEQAVRWLLPAALSAMDAGDFNAASGLAQRGLNRAAVGEQRGTLLLVQGYVAAHRSDACVESLAEALTLLPQGSPYWWLTLSALIFGAMSSGRRDLALTYIPLAIHTAPGAELTGPCGAALQAMSAGLVIIGQTDAAWSVVNQFARAIPEAAQVDPLFVAWLDLARCQLATASRIDGAWQLERALIWGRGAADTMQSLGAMHGQATSAFYFGYTSRILGLYDEAERALTRSLELGTRTGNFLIVQYSKLILTLVRLQRGDTDGALALLHSLSDATDASVAHGMRVMLAETSFRRGEFTAAVSGASAVLQGASVPYRRVAYCTLARAQFALGEHAAALATIEAALQVKAPATPEYELDLLATKVSALRALGDEAQAAEVLVHALSVLDALLAGIRDPELRQTFTSAIESNARVIALSRETRP